MHRPDQRELRRDRVRRDRAVGSLARGGTSFAAVHWRSRSELDDTLDVFPCHGVGGMVGMLLTGALATTAVNADGADGLIHGGTSLFGAHALALVIVATFSFTASLALFKLTDLILPLRVSEEHEAQGLDLSQHAETIHVPHEEPALAAV